MPTLREMEAKLLIDTKKQLKFNKKINQLFIFSICLILAYASIDTYQKVFADHPDINFITLSEKILFGLFIASLFVPPISKMSAKKIKETFDRLLFMHMSARKNIVARLKEDIKSGESTPEKIEKSQKKIEKLENDLLILQEIEKKRKTYDKMFEKDIMFIQGIPDNGINEPWYG